MGPRLALSASDPETLDSAPARDAARAAEAAGFTVTTLRPGSGDGWSSVIDLLLALDAETVLTTRARLVLQNPDMAIMVVADEEPDDRVRRAVRLVDVVVAPAVRHERLRELPLRPAVLDLPDSERGWRAVFEEALAHRDRSHQHGRT